MSSIPLSPVAKRFAWKEFRTLRGFWIAALILAALIQWFLLAAHDRPPSIGWPAALFIVALIAAAFYAVGVAATTFSMEHEEGTYAFLTGLPTRWLPIFAGKLLFALTSALSLAVALTVFACILNGGELPSRADAAFALGAFGFIIVEALVWGAFFSLILRQPLLAALLAIGAVSMSLYWLTTTFVEGHLSSVSISSYLAVLPQRVTLAVGVFLIDIFLARRWLVIDRPRSAVQPRIIPPPSSAAAADDHVACRSVPLSSESNNNTSFRVLSHLLWQTWRGSGRSVLAAACVATLLYCAPYVVMSGVRWESWQQWLTFTPFTIGLVVTALYASLVFSADQRDRSYRFLAEHAAWPRYVWISRLVVWLLPVLLVLGIAVVMRGLGARHLAAELFDIEVGSSYWDQHGQAIEYFAGTFDFAPWGVLLGFAVGQACSLFFRRAIVAGFAAAVITMPLLLWGLAVWSWELSRFTFLLPIVIGLFVATWLRASDWLIDRNSPRAWFKVGAALAIPLLFAAWRLPAARELPAANDQIALAQIAGAMGVVPSFNNGSAPMDVSSITSDWVTQYKSKVTAADRALGDRLVRLSESVTWPPNPNRKANDDPTAAERDAYYQQFVKLNRAIADEAVLLSEKNFAFAPRLDLSRVIDDPAYNQVIHLKDLVSDTGVQLTKEGKLDDALKFHLAALRLWDRLFDRVPIGILPSSDVRRKLELRLVDWANAEGQSADRIRGAISALDAIDSPVGAAATNKVEQGSSIDHWLPPEPLIADYLALREIVLGKRPSNLLNRNAYIAEYVAVIANQLPFERARALKLLDYLLVVRTAQWHDVVSEIDQSSLQRLSHGEVAAGGAASTVHVGRKIRGQIQLAFESNFDPHQVAHKQRDYPPYSWLRTSGLLRMELERLGHFGLWLTSVVDRQVAAWGLRQQLALVAYRLDHGVYPDSLDALVPDYLPFVPIDAYSGLPFEFRPKGLPLPLRADRDMGSKIAAGTPLLWSAGGGDARLQVVSDVEAVDPTFDGDVSQGVEVANRGTYVLKERYFDYWYIAGPLLFPLPKPPAESLKSTTP